MEQETDAQKVIKCSPVLHSEKLELRNKEDDLKEKLFIIPKETDIWLLSKKLLEAKHPNYRLRKFRESHYEDIKNRLRKYSENLIYVLLEHFLQIQNNGKDNEIIIVAVQDIFVYLMVFGENEPKKRINDDLSFEQANKKPNIKESDELLTNNSKEIIKGLSISSIPCNSSIFLNKFIITTKCWFIERESNPSEGVSIYFKGNYSNRDVFVKISCYKSYRENVECMNYLKNIKSKYLNEIIKYEKLQFDKNDIMEIFFLTSDEFDYLKLNGQVYLTILSPVSVWYEYFTSNYFQIYPLNNLKNCKTITLLILKLFIDNIHGMKELHSHNIAHVDFNILNSNIAIDMTQTTTSTDLINKYLSNNYLPKFNMVLIDFNSSRISNQELFSEHYIPKSTHYPQDFIGVEFGLTPEISFTKAHDIYSLSIVMVQYIDILLTCYSTSDNLMKSFVVKYIQQSHNREKGTCYDIYNVMKHLKDKLNSIMLGNETLINTFDELFNIITSMNQEPWKCINEFNYYLEELNSLTIKVEQLKVLNFHRNQIYPESDCSTGGKQIMALSSDSLF